MIKDDLYALIKEVNHTFLTLVPKLHKAVELGDFRPIACCNVLYRTVSKILANRLQEMVSGLVTLNQTIFIKGG